FRSTETFVLHEKGYSKRENVGRLHELQGRKLRRDRVAVRLDFRRRDRKRVLRVYGLLHDHQKGTSTRESVVWIGKGDCEPASTGESCQTLTRILLVLLTSARSKSTLRHETREAGRVETSTDTWSSSEKDISVDHKQLNKGNWNTSRPIETLFIPEEPARYAEILEQLRELLESSEVPETVEPCGNQQNPVDGGTRWEFEEQRTEHSEGPLGQVAENTSREDPATDTSSMEDQFFNVQNGRNSSLEVNEEKYLARNPTVVSLAAENNGNDKAVSVEGNSEDHRVQEKNDPDEEDYLEAANFGLEAMKNLYLVTEPTLYSMGLYLDSDNPAKYLATFNDQTEEARRLAKYGFAVLQGTTMFKKKFPDATTDLLLARRSQSNPLQRHCPNRGVPHCPRASLRYRTSDGSCNNLRNLWWGSAMSPMQRFLAPVYDDGVQSIRRSTSGRPLPSAREVTNLIHEDRDVPLASVTHMLMQWGQFVDHDLTATGQSRGFNGTIPQCCLNFGTGFQPPEFMVIIHRHPKHDYLDFLRSGPAPREDCKFGPREQLTQVTSYLDASTVYSSNAFQTDTLRLFRNGLLQYGKIQSQRPVLPKQDSDLCRRGSLSTSCFRAGDGRLGEQPALTSLHVIFLRLHNRIATNLAALNPHWSDEKLFQESRRIVGAVVQHITYREFLPIVLGQDVTKIFDLEVLKKGYYNGYNPTMNPTIANGFSTAAYRFGHSLVQRSFIRFDSDHQPIFNNVTIHKEFSNPANLETAGSVDRLLLGLINQPSQRRDEHISDELTNHLFQTPGFPFGMDLASINIQRGRDHGISENRVVCRE
ncbi:Chorion peroxidase, partial [Dufourea novaeangliae]